jgi:hypothetical protein
MPVREQYLPSLPITRIIVPVRRSGLTSGSTGTPINPAPGEPCRYMHKLIKNVITNILAIIGAIVFFFIIGTLFFFSASISMNLVYVILAIIGVAIIYYATGGRAWFGTHEKPQKILGIRLKITEPDGLGPTPPDLPEAIATYYENGRYKLEFVEPFHFEGRTEKFVFINARHIGYPISRVRRHGWLGVNGTLESGAGFIANLTRV